MNYSHKLFYKAVLISSLFLFTLYSFALACQKPLDAQHTIMPASDYLIRINLEMPNNRLITVSQYSGEMIITGPVGGPKLGITPRLLNDGRVILEFFRISKDIKRKAYFAELISSQGEVSLGESNISLGSMELKSGFSQSSPIDQLVHIQLLSVSKMPRGLATKASNSGPKCPCCVTCDGETTCGISVVVNCGSCNCRD